MQLSDIPITNAEIYRDACFSQIGHPFSPIKKRFVPVQNEEDLQYCIKNPDVAAVMIPPDLLPMVNDKIGVVLSPNPIRTALEICHIINPNTQEATSIHPSAKIHPSAEISSVQVKIGKNVQIDEYVTLESGTEIRDNVVINALTRIGTLSHESDPVTRSDPGEAYGTILIHEGTFIHANCMIERPIFADTTCIGTRCQIDSLSVIRAGVKMGSYSLAAGIVTIGEYARIGERSWVGPRCTIGRGIIIGDSCHVTLGSKVTKNIGPNKMVKDNWAVDRNKFRGIIPG